MKGELVKEQQRSAGLERSRAVFLSVWRENRRRSGAARLIQRRYRAQRLHQLLARTQLNAKVRLWCTCVKSCVWPFTSLSWIYSIRFHLS